MIVVRRSRVAWYRSKNSLMMWMLSSTAMGMMKIGIMLDMMWIGNPLITSRPIVSTTETRATTIGAMTTTSLRKNRSMSTRMTAMAAGAEMAIWMNISTPKVSSATGSPVM